MQKREGEEAIRESVYRKGKERKGRSYTKEIGKRMSRCDKGDKREEKNCKKQKNGR